MKKIWITSLYTIKESLRHRIFLFFLVFVALSFVLSRLLSGITHHQQSRMLFDFSLGFLSLSFLFLCIYVSSFLLQKELDARSLLFSLSRPINRTQFLLGKYFGYLSSLFLLFLFCVIFQVLFLLLFGLDLNSDVFLAIYGIGLDIFVFTSMCFVFSMTSNTFLSILFCFCFWILSNSHHVLNFFQFSKEDVLLKAIVDFIPYISPDFQVWNWKDLIYTTSEFTAAYFLQANALAFFWSSVFLFLSLLIFERRECV